MKIFTQLKFIVLAVTVIAAISSCRTYSNGGDDVTPPNPTTGTGNGSDNQNQVVIAFPRTSIDINTTDSVVAVLSSGTSTIRKKATKGGTFYTISLNGVYTGTWSTNIKVYTKSRMYRFETALNTANSSTFVGPTGKLADNWKTNLFVHDSNYGISFAVAALPTDAYYELFLPPTLIGYTHVYFERYVYKTIDSTDNVVQYGVLNFKAADYKGFQANTTAFAPFATAMKNQPWDTADVSLQLYNEGSSTSYKVIFQASVKNE
ncbi:hypothetical protein [Mucilaginibacter terrae]|uniref:Lipoprotein n=1 Tax=Mucilaginibacter terrae TaxID=1955052 RepID=A0ABU3GST9_9SPHI|nr:hypothetical protein [Mucilaginibacter terrae]MDT3402840.1 hypothetical protein [Mucilaginibacter terrae]